MRDSNRIVRSGTRRAYTLAVAGFASIARATRSSIASAGIAVAEYRAHRAAVRVARRQIAASVADPSSVIAVDLPPTDPTTERERRIEALERHQLSLREEALGPDDPNVALLTHIIATRCAARGEYDEARVLYERTVRIFERSLGADHPELADALTDLAELHAATGRLDEAARCATRAADITARHALRARTAIESSAELRPSA